MNTVERLTAALTIAGFTLKPTSRASRWYTRKHPTKAHDIDVVISPSPEPGGRINNIVVRQQDPAAKLGQQVVWTASFDGNAPFDTVKAAIHATLDTLE